MYWTVDWEVPFSCRRPLTFSVWTATPCSCFLLSAVSCWCGRTVGEPAHGLLLRAGFTAVLVFLYQVGKEGCRARAQMPLVKFQSNSCPCGPLDRYFWVNAWGVGQLVFLWEVSVFWELRWSCDVRKRVNSSAVRGHCSVGTEQLAET